MIRKTIFIIIQDNAGKIDKILCACDSERIARQKCLILKSKNDKLEFRYEAIDFHCWV